MISIETFHRNYLSRLCTQKYANSFVYSRSFLFNFKCKPDNYWSLLLLHYYFFIINKYKTIFFTIQTRCFVEKFSNEIEMALSEHCLWRTICFLRRWLRYRGVHFPAFVLPLFRTVCQRAGKIHTFMEHLHTHTNINRRIRDYVWNEIWARWNSRFIFSVTM